MQGSGPDERMRAIAGQNGAAVRTPFGVVVGFFFSAAHTHARTCALFIALRLHSGWRPARLTHRGRGGGAQRANQNSPCV